MIEQSEQIKRKPEMDVVADLCMSRGRRGAGATWGSRAGAGVREGAGGLASTGCWCCGGAADRGEPQERRGDVAVWTFGRHRSTNTNTRRRGVRIEGGGRRRPGPIARAGRSYCSGGGRSHGGSSLSSSSSSTSASEVFMDTSSRLVLPPPEGEHLHGRQFLGGEIKRIAGAGRGGHSQIRVQGRGGARVAGASVIRVQVRGGARAAGVAIGAGMGAGSRRRRRVTGSGVGGRCGWTKTCIDCGPALIAKRDMLSIYFHIPVFFLMD